MISSDLGLICIKQLIPMLTTKLSLKTSTLEISNRIPDDVTVEFYYLSVSKLCAAREDSPVCMFQRKCKRYRKGGAFGGELMGKTWSSSESFRN